MAGDYKNYKSESKRRKALFPPGKKLTLADVNDYVKRKKYGKR
jgi:hypothetical protein